MATFTITYHEDRIVIQNGDSVACTISPAGVELLQIIHDGLSAAGHEVVGGILSATDFIAWTKAHPDASQNEEDARLACIPLAEIPKLQKWVADQKAIDGDFSDVVIH